jgi:hypothetical protein
LQVNKCFESDNTTLVKIRHIFERHSFGNFARIANGQTPESIIGSERSRVGGSV